MARILAVDDEPHILSIVSRVLKAEGYEPITASNGRDGIRAAHEHRPDLILCDIVMPEPNGLEVLAALRRDRATASIPVVFLTGVPDPKQLRAGRALGAEDYLLKPFTKQELLHAVEARLARVAFVRRETQRRLDELRTQLSASLPENLLAPTTALLGLSTFLRDEGSSAPPEVICEVAQGIFEGSQRLHRAIEKFVTYADLERLAQAARTKPALGADHVSQTAAVVSAAAREAAAWQQREGALELAVDDVAVRLDAAHLRRLVLELVENAAAHTPAGKSISVVCRRDSPATCLLTVADHGPGMSEGRVQGEAPSTSGGLGLAIVRHIVALCGAELSIESSPAAGTIVRVALRAA